MYGGLAAGSAGYDVVYELNALESVTVQPNRVLGGSSATGTVTLAITAPPAGAIVKLTSSNPAAKLPATVIVPAGGNSVSFTVTTEPVAVTTKVTITASYGGTSRTTVQTVAP